MWETNQTGVHPSWLERTKTIRRDDCGNRQSHSWRDHLGWRTLRETDKDCTPSGWVPSEVELASGKAFARPTRAVIMASLSYQFTFVEQICVKLMYLVKTNRAMAMCERKRERESVLGLCVSPESCS